MKDPRLAVAATSFMDETSPHLQPLSSVSPSSSSNSVLSSLSSHSTASSLSKSSPSAAISPCPTQKPSFSLLRKRKGAKWVSISRLFRLHKLSMEATDESFLLHTNSQGHHGSWADADQQHKSEEKPKRELRFAAKIAAAMDADGFIGVKDCVCAEDRPVGMQQSVCVKNVGGLYCGPSPVNLQRAPLKQPRPRPRRRKWRFLRRLRRTRVLFSSILQKVKKAFTTSSKQSLQVRDGFIK